MNELFAPIHAIVQKGMALAIAFDVPNLISAGVFYALAAVALLGAMGVVFFRNVVHSALSLTASFIGIGCLYIFLSADFNLLSIFIISKTSPPAISLPLR